MSEVKLKITADASDALSDQERVRKGFDRLKTSANSFSKSFSNTVNSRVKRAFSKMRGWLSSLGGAFGALKSIISSVFNKMFSLISIITLGFLAKQVHQLTSAFIGQENALGAVVGTTKSAAQAMRFLISEGQRLGADFQTLTKSYVKFMAAGKESRSTSEELHDMFIALAETSVVLQFSSQELEGAFRALTQMMSKGRVQAEELRGQLGEHLPGAFEIAAKSMGLTTKELDNMLKKGEITAKMLIEKLPIGLREAYGSALPGAIKTARAEFTRLSNDVKIFLEDNKEAFDATFKKIAFAVRKLFENIQKSGLLEWLGGTNTGFEVMLDFIAEIPQNLEIIAIKAKSFYEQSILQLREFELQFRKFVGVITEDELMLISPRIEVGSMYGEGNDNFGDFLNSLDMDGDVEIWGDQVGKGFETFFKQQMNVIDEEADAKIEAIREKYKNALPRTLETTGTLPPEFDTNATAKEELEGLNKSEQNRVAAFERMVAKLQGFKELEIITYQQSREKVDLLLSDGLITEEEHLEAIELLYTKHNLKLLEIQEDYTLESLKAQEERINEEARGWSTSAILAQENSKFQKMTSKEVTKSLLGNMEALTAGIAGESKKAFELNKMFAIANALIKGYESVISSYAAGTKIGGPVVGAAFAAVAALATGQMIQQIRSQTFQGGSNPTAPSSSVPDSVPPPPVQDDPIQQSTGILIQIDGNLYANDDFRLALIEALELAQSNDEIRIVNI